jgi:hypothetical protein
VPQRPKRIWRHDHARSSHRITKQPDHHPACTAGGGTGQGNPRRLVWNSTSADRERQARDAPWSCGNQPAYHGMINRRSVPAPTAHARISEMRPGEKEPDGILRPDPLKTDMTTSLTARSQGLPVPPCAVLKPQGQAATPAQPRFVFRPVLDLERHFRNVVAAIGVVDDRRCVCAASGGQDQGCECHSTSPWSECTNATAMTSRS